MLLAGSDDGVYRVDDVNGADEQDAVRVLASGRVLRIRSFDAIDGVFAATTDGLYYSMNGDEWVDLDVPQDAVYAVTATPDGTNIYAGTRPAHLYTAEITDSDSLRAGLDWDELDGFRALATRADWGIDRHDGIAQVRSLQIPADTPDRLVAGVEVGGVYVSDDRGATWQDRRISGFDAPHTDDIHHLALEDSETIVAATGSGLYRSTDTGRSWSRLDTEHRQSYFREVAVHDGVRFAGGSPTSPRYWTDDRDHGLFECHDGETLLSAAMPAADEVAVGWCMTGEKLITATNRGTLLQRTPDAWREVGSIPVPESVHGRCIPLMSFEN